MCKEMLVIPVNRVVDLKRIMGKTEGQGGGEVQGVADPKKLLKVSQPVWNQIKTLRWQVREVQKNC
jgi:hypothetical protein